MKTNSWQWTIAVFFGCAIIFAAIRRLTQGHGAGVTLIVQLVALVLIVAGLILFVRRRGDD